MPPTLFALRDSGAQGIDLKRKTFSGSQSLTTSQGIPIAFGYASQNYDGVFLGGGMDTALAGWLPGLPAGLLLRTEYRFSDYGRRFLSEINFATGAPDGNVENTRPYVQTVTTSLIWRFDWSAPTAAGH